MAKIEDDDVATFSQFRGLRNTVGPESFEVGDLEAALNVDITDELRIRRRRGYTAFVAGAHHSLFANGEVMLAVSGTSLVRITPEAVSSTLRTGLTSGARLAYSALGDRIYYSNAIQTGCVQAGVHRTWGLEIPSAQPGASVVGGSMRPGTYQYALTYVRSDGQESGTGLAGSIALPASGGIQFDAIPVSSDPTVTSKRLYISPPDGDAMYYALGLHASDTSATIYSGPEGTMILATQFKGPPPAGSCLAHYNGHALVAVGSRLYFSEPYAPELFDLRRGYRFSSPITIVAPVDDGVYLGTETEVIFLEGRDVTELVYRPRCDYGAIFGTLAYSSADDVNPNAQGRAAIFATTQGICAGYNGGQIANLTQERFSYPVTKRGAAVVRNYGGSVQYLVVLEGTSTAGNTAF